MADEINNYLVVVDGNDIAVLDFVFYKKLEKRLKTVKTVLKARYSLK